jgi:hypothetical protein
VDISTIANGIAFYALQQDDVLPKLKTGTVHERLLVSAGQMSLSSLSWAGVGEPMIAQCRVTPLSTDGTSTYWPRTAVAAPAAPPLESDFEVTRVRYNGVDITELANFDLSFDAPLALRYQIGKTYPQGLTLAPAGGVVAIRARLQVPERSYHRSWGDAFQGPANLVVDLKNYAQAAERGATSYSMSLRSTGEVTQNTDARPSSTDLEFASIKDTTDASAVFTWG